MNIKEAVAVGSNFASFMSDIEEGEGWRKDAAQLVRDCWKYDPEKRPRASEVAKRIGEIKVKHGI